MMLRQRGRAVPLRTGARYLGSVPAWATVDPSSNEPMVVLNRVDGKWTKSRAAPIKIPDPLNAKNDSLQLIENTQKDEVAPFLASLKQCPKSGLHNPLKNPQRFVEYGHVVHKMAAELEKKEVEDFFAKLIQRVMPKSYAQCYGEVKVTRQFLRSFAGDSTRFTVGRGFSVSGDHPGQESRGYRWPFGPVAIIAPFNFPLEIPALQMMAAVLAGNKVLVKPSEKVAIVFDQFARLMLACGAPSDDVMILNGSGMTAEGVVCDPIVKLTQFTGSSPVANKLAEKTKGKVKLEDAGFNWKVLGPRVGVSDHDAQYVAWVCDQDAYAASGQKCSAQSCLFVHSDWSAPAVDIVGRIKKLAERRTFKDMTIGPVLSWTSEAMLAHVDACLKNIPNSKLAFGGKRLKDKGAELVPSQYGLIEPSAVRCSIKDILSSDKAFSTFSTEVFGPFQVIVDYTTSDADLVLQAMERMDHHLTAAVVSSDPNFCNKFLANTINGTTYAGIRARTTGAPTNHWFGPGGDPRAAGIGSIEAVIQGWTYHREIVQDVLDPSKEWTTPSAT